jgi:hypothetical protein
VRIFKTKVFARFARKERISDAMLREAVQRAERGLVDADLSGGLIKQRVARPGAGRSGGFRVLMGFRPKVRTVFILGFAKSDQANISTRHEAGYRALALAALNADNAVLARALAAGELIEITAKGVSDEKD